MGAALAAIGTALGSTSGAAAGSAATAAGASTTASAAAAAAATAQATAVGASAVGAGVGAVSAGMQYQQGQKAADAMKGVGNAQLAQQERNARRDRLRIIREGRIKAANIEAIGANTGASESSGVMGGMGSVQSQVAGNVQNNKSNMALSKQITGYSQDASNAASASSMWGTIGGIGGQVFSDYGGYKTIFGDGG